MVISSRSILIAFAFFLFSSQSPLLFGASAHKNTLTSPVKRIWITSLKKSSWFRKHQYQFSKPILNKADLFVGVEKGYFYSINQKKGKKNWRRRTAGPIYSKPASTDWGVYFGDAKGNVYALDRKNGDLLWTADLKSKIDSAPLIKNETIYFVTAAKRLFAFDLKDGFLKWQSLPLEQDHQFSILGSSDPYFLDGKVIVGYSDGSLFAYNAGDGSIAWVKQLGSAYASFQDLDSNILSVGELIYLSSADGEFYAINPKDGSLQWSLPIGTVNNIVLDENKLYLTSFGKVYCLDSKKGNVLWENDLGVPALSSPSLLGPFVVVIATRGKIYFLRKKGGDMEYWRYLARGSFSEPLVDGDNLYVLSNKGNLAKFRLKKKWKGMDLALVQ